MGDLLLGTKLDEEQEEYTTVIMESSKSLLIILNDILDLSKIEARKLNIEHIPMEINELINSVIKLMMVSTKQKGIELNLNIGKDVPGNIKGDPERLRQILVNILGNAIKFTEKGSVTLNVSVNEKSSSQYIYKFEVIDTGIGIEKEAIKNIFDKFTQADQSTTRKFGGTGLGLTITKQLIDMMGGTIDVTSERHKGSIFCIEIPLEISTFKIQKVVTERSNEVKSFNNLNVLLVEDNLINQKLAIKIFQKLNCNVDLAENGLIALNKTKESKYEIVFMDCQMPEMNGYQATREIRTREKEESLERLLIVAMTANAMIGDREKCIDSGMDDFLSKPIKKSDISNMLEKYFKA